MILTVRITRYNIIINHCLTKSKLPDNNCTKAIFTPNWIIGHIDTSVAQKMLYKNYIDVLLAPSVVHHNVLYILALNDNLKWKSTLNLNFDIILQYNTIQYNIL